jgi:hypothetical protein
VSPLEKLALETKQGLLVTTYHIRKNQARNISLEFIVVSSLPRRQAIVGINELFHLLIKMILTPVEKELRDLNIEEAPICPSVFPCVQDIV